MILNLENFPRKSFSKHFLNSVHCEIGLESVESKKIFDRAEEFKSKFLEIGFQSTDKVEVGTLSLEKKDEESLNKISHSTQFHGLVFKSQPPDKIVELNTSQLLMSIQNYESFEDFFPIFQKSVKIMEDTLTVRPVSKIGLKKVNKIEISGFKSIDSVCDIFNSNLLGGFRSGVGQLEDLVATQESFVFKRNGITCFLTLNISKKENNILVAILEFDCVVQKNTTTKEVFEQILSDINEFHFDLFMWSITKKFRELLGDK